jgi:nucleoside phosphorylase
MQPAPSPRVDVLVVAAHAPELVGLRPMLTEKLDGSIRGLRVVGKTLGIGMPVAGGAMANRLQQLSPRCVVLLGSCGVYAGIADYRPNDVLVASRITLFDHAVAAGRAAFPDPMTTTLETHTLLATGLGTGPRTRVAQVATTLSITIDDALAGTVHRASGCEGENLEAFSVALACHAASVPFAAVLGVTNIVGSRGREDWRTYQRSAAVAAADCVIAWMQQGAQGLPHGG